MFGRANHVSVEETNISEAKMESRKTDDTDAVPSVKSKVKARHSSRSGATSLDKLDTKSDEVTDVSSDDTDPVPSVKSKVKARHSSRSGATSLDKLELEGSVGASKCFRLLPQFRDDSVSDGPIPRLRRTKSVFMNDIIPECSEELYDSLDSGEEYIPNSESSEDSLSDVSSVTIAKLSPRKKVLRDIASTSKHIVPDSTIVNEEDGDSSEAECEWTDDEDCAGTSQRPVRRNAPACVEGQIHVPAVKKNNGKRVYNKRHYCLYCEKSCSKIARHLQLKHSDEGKVLEAFSFPKGSKKRKLHLDLIRNQGNFAHNAAVMKKGEGELVACKRPCKDSKRDDYMHCAYCQGLFIRKILWRHIKVCQFRSKEARPQRGKNKVQALCSFAEPAPDDISERIWKLLSVMQADEITSAVKNDRHIIRIAEQLLNKKGSSDASQAYIRQTLRELGRLLIAARNATTLKTMADFINPKKYVEVVKAVKLTCGYDEETEKYRVPSLAKKIGNALSKLSKVVKVQALIAGDKVLEKKATDFQEVHSEKWNELVSATAARNASESQWNVPTMLPFTEDVQKLHTFLNKNCDECSSNLLEEASEKNWSALAKVVMAEIILFNRRREGEVSRMRLSSFLTRDTSTPHGDIDWALSEAEKVLCKHFTRVIIRGKRGRAVPILLTPKMVDALDLLVKKRDACGVIKTNQYMFARPSATTHFRGSDSLRSFALACSAKCPKALTSTKLRKHAATLSTVLNMSNTEMDQLANFLGHDIRIHREFYRLPDKTLQLAKVSKVLIALEQGRIADFQGKSLDEINIDPQEAAGECDQEPNEEELCEQELSDEEPNDKEDATVPGTPCTDVSERRAVQSPRGQKSSPGQRRDCPTRHQPASKGKSVVKRKWTAKEIGAVEKKLMRFIRSGQVPETEEHIVCVHANQVPRNVIKTKFLCDLRNMMSPQVIKELVRPTTYSNLSSQWEQDEMFTEGAVTHVNPVTATGGAH
ncbi:uncharacterized protein LOC114473662 [Gouania willdenowi]|uniref:uncharacterized protein LOC114473662 n=1 Tax=Gouania willdenowi TaxID=441366 RepID=UPI001055F76E|nr:uncharacterized protein LOC114473662 [Gouania willdenowi]